MEGKNFVPRSAQMPEVSGIEVMKPRDAVLESLKSLKQKMHVVIDSHNVLAEKHSSEAMATFFDYLFGDIDIAIKELSGSSSEMSGADARGKFEDVLRISPLMINSGVAMYSRELKREGKGPEEYGAKHDALKEALIVVLGDTAKQLDAIPTTE